MAVVSRVATLRLNTNPDTGNRTWTATAAVQDTQAGQSVSISFVQNRTGAAPPTLPTALTLAVMIDNTQTAITSFSPTPNDTDGNTQAFTFHFTDTGASGGVSRAGTVKLKITAAQTGGLAATQYTVNTDNNPADSFGTGNTQTVGQRDQGWIRGTTTLTEAISNISLGGAKAEPAEYDESLFVRTTSGAVSFTARSLTVATSVGGLSGSTNSTTAAQRDVTFSNVIDDRFPAAVTSVGVAVTVPNASLTAQPDWTYTSTTDDSINVDPRLTASHHFQTDDNVFAVSKNDLSKFMLSTQTGFLATRFVTSRTISGVNGLTVTQTLTPVAPGTAVSSSTLTTTKDSQAGWTGFVDWTSSKPGGTWNKSVSITAPTDIDAAGYILNGTDAYTMLAPDPRIVIRGYLNINEGNRHHFVAGTPVTISAVVEDITTGTRIAPSRVTEPAVAIRRYDSTATRLEYLDSTLAWNVWDEAEAEHFFSMSPAVGDARLYVKSFTGAETLTWTRDLRLTLRCKVDGTPYSGFSFREETGNFHRHDTEPVSGGGMQPMVDSYSDSVVSESSSSSVVADTSSETVVSESFSESVVSEG